MSNRDRLLESAGELLWDRGYVGTSPAAIQRLAEAGQGSMYHHFAGKHGLAVEAITATARDMRTRAEAVFDGTEPALERVLAYLRLERDSLRGCPIGRMALDPDVVADDDLRRPVEAFFSWLTGRMCRLLEEARDRGQIAPHLVPGQVAAALVATIQGGYVLARARQDASAMAGAIDGIATLLATSKD